MKINVNDLDKIFLPGFIELYKQLGLENSDDGITLTAEKGNLPAVKREDNRITIYYNKPHQFFRMLSMIKRIDGFYEEAPEHTDLCYMLDQSRNAVLKPEQAERFVRYLALSGFNALMLYTEDTYEIDGEDYFGFMRSKWKKSEIKKLVEYANKFHIELVPCIQTLAHLERPMRWKKYKEICDSGNVLLVGDERTYELIDKMFASCRECFTSNRINIGMDEAAGLGVGKYMQKNGYRDRSEIMLEHLSRVCEIAKKHGFKPMMWSDMFFFLAFNAYGVTSGTIPDDVKKKVPPEVTLIYWDYYSSDRKETSHMVSCHKEFNNPVAFAGGLQRWARFTAVNEFSITVEDMHLEECFKQGITDILATAWGDGGSDSSSFSIMPTMVFYGEKCFKRNVERDWLEMRLKEVCNVDMQPFTYMNNMDYLDGFPKLDRGGNRFTMVPLYADLLSAAYYLHIEKDTCEKHYAELAEKIKPYTTDGEFAYVFDLVYKLALVAAKRSMLINEIRDSYNAGNKSRLKELAEKDIPEAISLTKDFLRAVETQWKTENRNSGLEVQQIRLGGIIQRMNGVKEIIEEYVDGKTTAIDELDEEPLYADCRDKNSTASLDITDYGYFWSRLASVNLI